MKCIDCDQDVRKVKPATIDHDGVVGYVCWKCWLEWVPFMKPKEKSNAT